jgi:predicted translin family RNA/ssDNA-binding protein
MISEPTLETLRDIALYHGTIATRAHKDSLSDARPDVLKRADEAVAKLHRGYADTLLALLNEPEALTQAEHCLNIAMERGIQALKERIGDVVTMQESDPAITGITQSDKDAALDAAAKDAAAIETLIARLPVAFVPAQFLGRSA